MRLILALTAAAATAFVACGDNGGGTTVAISELPRPESGAVQLQPGSYRTVRFSPSVSFAVGDGWLVERDDEAWAQLIRRTAVGPHVNLELTLIRPSGIIDSVTQEAGELPGGTEELVQWLASNPSLSTSNRSSLQVGGLLGQQLEVTPATGGETVEYLVVGAHEYLIPSGYNQHLIVLDFLGEPVVVAVSAPADEFSEFLRLTEPIIGTFMFTDSGLFQRSSGATVAVRAAGRRAKAGGGRDQRGRDDAAAGD